MTRSEMSVAATRAVLHAGEFRGHLDERGEQIGVVVVELALDHRGDALEAHAGVDAGRGQGSERARRVAVELHEDEVPDLEIPVALARDAEAGAARATSPQGRGSLALEEVKLGAGTARAGVAHGPEVVLLPELEDALGRHERAPEIVGDSGP